MKALLFVVGICGAAIAASAAEEFHVPLEPATQTTTPGQTVEIAVAVDASAHQFNGYEIALRYDPTLVAFQDMSEGALMVGACANRFRVQTAPDDSTVGYTHVLLCQGVSVDGPGVLSLYRFQTLAPGNAAFSIVSDPDRSFFDAGLYVWPGHPTYPREVSFGTALVTITDPADAEDAPTAPGSSISISPNPTRDASQVRLSLPAAGPWTLRLVDAGGAERARWSGTSGERGEAIDLMLDGRAGAAMMPRGVLFLMLDVAGRKETAKWVLVR